MVAKLSLLFNAILGYAVLRLHNDGTTVNQALIKVHIQRYDDMKNLLVDLNLIKKEIKSEDPDLEKIENVIEDVKKKAQKKALDP